MRILALKTEGLVLPSIHESTVWAFQSLGIEVVDLPVPRNEEEYLSLTRRAGGGFDAVFTLDMGRDFYFISNLKDLQSSFRIPWIIWFVDDPEGYRFPSACDPGRTLAFCWDSGIVRELSPGCSRIGIPLHHLPLAADPGIFFPERENRGSLRFPGGVFVGSTAGRNEFLSEAGTTSGFMEEFDSFRELVSRTGQSPPQALAWTYLREKTGRNLQTIQTDPLCRLWVHTAMYFLGTRKRRELVCHLIGPNGGVFGDSGWKSWAGELYRGKVTYGENLRGVYNQSAFVLEIRPPQAWSGLTQRVFDAGACGRPVLAEYSPELEIIFKPEDEFLSFRGEEEAVEMKRQFVRHPREASARAAKLRKRVLAEHTYRHRAEQMLRLFSRL
jgi:spore maturation protein CgeB